MNQVEKYWNEFRVKHHIQTSKYEAYSFSLGKEVEDELAQLVKIGRKTATTSAYELYDEDEYVPQVNDYNVILDGAGNPVCVTKTVVTEVVPFNQIMVEHAYHEGEGDRSYQHWHDVHVDFFTREYNEAGKTFTEDVPCLCEVFEVVE